MTEFIEMLREMGNLHIQCGLQGWQGYVKEGDQDLYCHDGQVLSILDIWTITDVRRTEDNYFYYGVSATDKFYYFRFPEEKEARRQWTELTSKWKNVWGRDIEVRTGE